MISLTDASNYCEHLRIFSLRRPVSSLMRLAMLGACFVLTVFGTYGTMRGDTEVTGESFLYLAYPAAIGLFLAILFLNWVYGSTMKLFAFGYPEGILLITFYAASFISLIWAPHKILGTGIAAMGAIVTVLAVSNYVTSRERLLVAVRLLCLYVWLTALLAFAGGVQSFYVNAFSLGPIYIEYNSIFWRVNSWFITSTAFGIFQAYGILAAFYLLWVVRRLWVKVLLLASVAAFVYGMILSGGRTAFVALAIAIILGAISQFSLRGRGVLANLLLFVCLALVVDYLSLDWEEFFVVNRFLSIDGDTADLGGRGEIWAENIPLFFSLNPFQVLFGGGLGTFQEVLNSPISAHSGFLRILVENGIIGFGIFLCMMSMLTWNGFKLVRYQRAPTPECRLFLMFIVFFYSGELVVQALMGISIDTLIFFSLLGLTLAERQVLLIEWRESISLRS